MASPSDLVQHYSNASFLTRLAALTSVGAVIGATMDRLQDIAVSQLVGFAVIFVVASLAELNRRYTHSYLSACYVSANPAGSNAGLPDSAWRDFYDLNESKWNSRRSRFFLSWLTYLPGLILGEYLVVQAAITSCGTVDILVSVLATGAALGILFWWVSQTKEGFRPEQLLLTARARQESQKTQLPSS